MSSRPSDRALRVAVLTSGGDSAGMNPAVRAVVKQAIVRYVYLSSDGSSEFNVLSISVIL